VKLSVLRNNQLEVDYETPILKEDDSYEIYLGRSDDCHILLDNHLISRHHALILLRRGNWILEVLSDFGGVTINGANVDKQEIKNGDKIVINDYILNVSDINFEKPEEISTKIEKPPEKDITPVQDQDSAQDLGNDDTHSDDELIETKETKIIDESIEDSGDEIVEDEFSDDDSFDDAVVADDEPDDGVVTDDDEFKEDQGEGFENGVVTNDDVGEGFSDDFGQDQDSELNDTGLSDSDSTGVFSGFAKYELIITGEHAQYDKFSIDDNEILIGRDAKKCQIFLNDAEVSTEHARIKKTLIDVTLIDLGSSNGTILNGARINQQVLTNGDVFTIGSTKFEVAIVSDLMEAEQDYLMPVEDGQEITVEEVIEEEVDFDELAGDGEHEGSYAVEGLSEEKSLLKNPKKRKMLIYGVVGLLLLTLLMDDEKETKKKKPKDVAKEQSAPGLKKKTKRVYTKEQLNELHSSYALARQYLSEGAYAEADLEIDKVIAIDSSYKTTIIVKSQITSALARFEEEERRKKEEEERIIRMKKIALKLTRAREEVKAKQMAITKTVSAWHANIPADPPLEFISLLIFS